MATTIRRASNPPHPRARGSLEADAGTTAATRSGDGHTRRWPIKGLLVLNLLDGLFTLAFLQLALAEELNPLMRAAWNDSPLTFMALKLGVVQLGVWILWLHEELRIVRLAVLLAFGLYAGVVLYHLSFLAVLVLR